MLKYPERDQTRLSLYPNLDYKGLYNAIIELVDVASAIQYGLQSKHIKFSGSLNSFVYIFSIYIIIFLAFGEALLQCLGCLMPFLDSDMIDTLPYLTASTMAVLPNILHQEIVHSLYFYILPFTISEQTLNLLLFHMHTFIQSSSNKKIDYILNF